MTTSSSETVITDLDMTVREAMQNLNRIERLQESPLLTCLLIHRRQVDEQLTSYEALRAVFDDILLELHTQMPDYADLLRGRFWQGHQVKKMVMEQRPASWSESSFYNHQNRALQQFILIFKERNALAHEVEASAVATQHDITNLSNQPHGIDVPPLPELVARPVIETMHRTALVSSSPQARWITTLVTRPTAVAFAFMLMAAAGLIWLFLSYRLEENRISATDSSSETSYESICGETRSVDTVAQPTFVASEGVSLFTVENTANGVLGNFVRTVAFDSSGLWLGYHAPDEQKQGGGVSHFNKTTWINCNQGAELDTKNINAIARDAEGKLWVAAEQNGGVMMFDGTQWHTFTTADGLPTNDTFSITVDDEGNVWIGTYQGVAKYNGRRWTVPYSQENQTIWSNHVHTITFDQDGGVWIGHHDAGISYLAANSTAWAHLTAAKELGSDNVRHILATVDANQTTLIWVATAGGGISRFDGQEWKRFTVTDGLPSNDVYQLAVDKYHRLWAATNAGVVYREGEKWQIYHTLPATSITFSAMDCTICPYDDDHVVTGTFAHGFTHSRLPYLTGAVDLLQVCFFVNEDQRVDNIIDVENICATPQQVDENHYQVVYPVALLPRTQVRLEVTARPRAPYQLLEGRGDFLSNLADDETTRFGAYSLMPVKGTIESGQPFIFTSYDDPLRIPEITDSQSLTISSSWRVWMHTRYTGPILDIVIQIAARLE